MPATLPLLKTFEMAERAMFLSLDKKLIAEKEMGAESWSETASALPAGRKLCDSCKASPAAVFCLADSASLCPACDGDVHAANRPASRHAGVRLCDVCEQAPAAVTCRVDAATLCSACDRDIHYANPISRRHQRHPVAPLYDGDAGLPEQEAEATSWLLPDTDPDPESGSPLYGSADSDLDLGLTPGGERKQQRKRCTASADGIVPVGGGNGYGPGLYPSPVVDGYPNYDLEYSRPKPFLYNFTSQGISQSISSSSMDVSMVPEHNSMIDVPNTFPTNEATPVPVSGVDREARVLRYKEKRKNRKFEKTVRYASRKAYAETRPRIKGRFAKRAELEIDPDPSYGVVPTF